MTNKLIQIKTLVEGQDEAFIDMADDPKNPCKSCGVCCTHFRISFPFWECDSNGGTVPERLVIPIVNTPFVAMKGSEHGGRCISLEGEIGKNISCNIYENRSSSCRKFHVWDEQGNPNPKCQDLRKKAGLTELMHLSQL